MAKYGIILKTTQKWTDGDRDHEVCVRQPTLEYKEASQALNEAVASLEATIGRKPDRTGVLGGWCGGYATWLGDKKSSQGRDDLTLFVNEGR